MKYYVLDENKNLVEAYDKEGVLAVLTQAIENGSLDEIVANSAFVSKIKCCVSGDTHQIAFVSMSKYNQLKADNQIRSNTYYFITDDSTEEDINIALEELGERINAVDNSSIKNIAVDRNELVVTFGNNTTKNVTMNANLLMPSSAMINESVGWKETIETTLEPYKMYLISLTFMGTHCGEHIFCMTSEATLNINHLFYNTSISQNGMVLTATFTQEEGKIKVSYTLKDAMYGSVFSLTISPTMTIKSKQIGSLN